MAMYADDVILYSTIIIQSLPLVMGEIKHYSNISGYKLNTNKSEAMVIGEPIFQDIQVKQRFKWEQGNLKYLGVIVPRDINKIMEYDLGTLKNNLKQDKGDGQ